MDQLSHGEWITIPSAAELLGSGTRAVRSLIGEGRLSVRTVPRSHPRVLRSEVVALASASTRPAAEELVPT